LDLKLWMIWKNNMPKEHSFSIILQTVHFKPLSLIPHQKFVSIALNQTLFSICTLNNALDVMMMRSLILIKKSVNLNLIIQTLQEWKTGISMAVIFLKLIKILHLVLIKNLILMESSVFHANFLFIGVCQQIFVKNVKLIKPLIWTLKNVRKY